MNGKQINTVAIWANGEIINCNWLICSSVFDDLRNVARFYYEVGINDEIGFFKVQVGNVSIAGDEYIAWDESSSVNDAAYQIVAQKLNLTIYEPTVNGTESESV